VAADHRHLDDVGGGALDHGVDGEALAERVLLAVARAQLGDLGRRRSSVVIALLVAWAIVCSMKRAPPGSARNRWR